MGRDEWYTLGSVGERTAYGDPSIDDEALPGHI